MKFEEYILNLLAGTFGGLISGIILSLYLDLLPQDSNVALISSLVVGNLMFLLFVFFGWVIFKGEEINLFKKRK